MSFTTPTLFASKANGDFVVIQSQCNCRRIVLDITLPKYYDDAFVYSKAKQLQAQVCNCHCIRCRKYHTSAYTSYLKVAKHQVSIRKGEDMIGKFTLLADHTTSTSADYCDHGKLERWFCTGCSSKLQSIDKVNEIQYCLVNMGPLNEATIPLSYTSKWREDLKQKENNLHSESMACWTIALPNYTSSSTTIPPIWTGSCACASCQYEIKITRAAQLQHCYCHLCRELSGGPFATWVPVYKRDFSWKQQHTLDFVRTTKDGRRHLCRQCRGVLTIVYDSQPDLIWPCVGGLDDASLPVNSREIARYLKRICHICCRHQPSWLDLPDDEMERIADAC
jgi:hypothetical protein